MSRKLTRRDAIRALAAAGAVIAAAPYMAKATGTVQTTPGSLGNVRIHSDVSGPLVILVTENEMTGFRGEQEFRIEDATLASQLNRTFSKRGVE